jgi:hypothetical protein
VFTETRLHSKILAARQLRRRAGKPAGLTDRRNYYQKSTKTGTNMHDSNKGHGGGEEASPAFLISSHCVPYNKDPLSL